VTGRMPAFDERDVYEIRSAIESGEKATLVARRYGVSAATIRNVVYKRGPYAGDKLTKAWDRWEERRREIVRMRDEEGMSFSAIGKHFGASRQWAHKTYHECVELMGGGA